MIDEKDSNLNLEQTVERIAKREGHLVTDEVPGPKVSGRFLYTLPLERRDTTLVVCNSENGIGLGYGEAVEAESCAHIGATSFTVTDH